jgi:hypothetical protein
MRLLVLASLLLTAPGCFAYYIGEASSVQRALAEPDRDRVAVAAVTARTHRPVYLHANLIDVTTPNSTGRVGLRGYNRRLTTGVIVLATWPAWMGLGAGIGGALGGGIGAAYGLGAGFLPSIFQIVAGSIVIIAGIVRPSQELTGEAARIHFQAPPGALQFGIRPPPPPPPPPPVAKLPLEQNNE